MAAISVNLRVNEGSQPQPVALWDSVYFAANGAVDWAYAQPQETGNVGGLQAIQALETAVILCLFTNKYCPPNHPLAHLIEGGDAMGWWGDGVDVDASQGEAALGSLWWLLARSTATPDMVMWTQSLALDALSVMVGQMSVAKVTATATLAGVNRIDCQIGLYAQDGTQLFNRNFADVWNQVAQYGVGVNGGDDGDFVTDYLGSAADPAGFDENLGSVAAPATSTINLNV